MTAWSTADIGPQEGRTAVVTGANSGLGLAATRALVRAGARVVLAVRNTDAGEAVAAELGGAVTVRRLDLADLTSVREFAAATDGPVDVLVNNAGLMAVGEEAHGRRVRDAGRGELPRALRADRTVAGPDHRPGGGAPRLSA